jgi:hypothetical protein
MARVKMSVSVPSHFAHFCEQLCDYNLFEYKSDVINLALEEFIISCYCESLAASLLPDVLNKLGSNPDNSIKELCFNLLYWNLRSHYPRASLYVPLTQYLCSDAISLIISNAFNKHSNSKCGYFTKDVLNNAVESTINMMSKL